MPKHSELLPLIEKAKNIMKKSDVVADLCKEYGADLDIIDLIPVAFVDNLDVSAKTDHGIIYLNSKLIDDFCDKHLHYLTHELTHTLQQCFGDGPTEGSSNSEDYLANEFEQEGFQNQTEFLSETKGDDAAEAYVDKVLKYHDIPEKDKNKRKKELLNLASDTWLLSKIAGKIDDAKERFPHLDIIELSKNDPTGDNKYLLWMATQIDKGFSPNDLYPTILSFHRNKSRLEKKDLYQYTDLKELENTIKDLSPSGRQLRKQIKGQSAKLYEDKDWVLVRPDTKGSCMYYGAGTRWCITMQDEVFYEEYSGNNVIFYFLMRKNPKGDYFDKIAYAIKRDKTTNSIIGDEIFNANDDPISNVNVVDVLNETDTNFKLIYNIMIADAEKQPKPLLARIDELSENEISQILDEYKHNTGILMKIIRKSSIDPNVFIKHPDNHVRRVFAEQAAYNYILDPDVFGSTWQELLSKMANDENYKIRMIVANNLDFHRYKHILDNMAKFDPSEAVRRIAIKQLELSEHDLKDIYSKQPVTT